MELARVTVWLTVNAGSTSLKLGCFRDAAALSAPADLERAFAGPPPDVVVHRVVHGGDRTTAARLDDRLMQELRDLTELAPLHQPPALDAAERCRRRWPDAVHVACFDTAFHRTVPTAARTYALPAALRREVRGFGFHGLSHAWAAGRVRAALPRARRTLIAHLGGGQSLCGVIDGRSVVTTMGFTPLDGLVMATRSGTVDPGAVLHLIRRGLTAAELDDAFERRGGLLGLTGTADMREVLARRAAGDPLATAGFDVWRHRFLRQAGGVVAVLGGLDALVFTGGIGENAREVRAVAADGLAWLGVAVRDPDADPDPDSDADSDPDVVDVTARGAAVTTLVVRAREDRQMITEARALGIG